MEGLVLWMLGAVFGASSVLSIPVNFEPPAEQEKTPPKIVFDIPPLSERIEIDGKKNPEMIPQWDVWQSAFELMVRTSDLPTEVWRGITKDEAEMILAAGKENARNFLACQERVLKLMPTLQTDEARFVNERTREINLDYRRQTLALRDRVLAALGSGGQQALVQYIESLKGTIRVFVPKNELQYYRLPE
jgi:hypothetical protein